MDLRSRIADLMGPAQGELAEFVDIRSVADPRQFPPEECERAAHWVLDKFAEIPDLRMPTSSGRRTAPTPWSDRDPDPTRIRPLCSSTRMMTCSHPSMMPHGVPLPSTSLK